MLRKVFILCLILWGAVQLSAQDNNEINIYSTIKYNHSINYGIFIHSGGLGANLNYLRNKSVYKNYLVNLSVMLLKHPKETRVINPSLTNARSYVFGKLNTAFVIRTGFGNSFILADKERPDNIRIQAYFNIGPDLVLLKPQYLTFIYHEPASGYNYRKVERFDPTNPYHNNQGNIYGGAPFYLGFDEMSAAAGAFLKLAFTFEWGTSEESYRQLEAGVMMDVFPEPLPLFAYIDNKYFFFNGFIAFKLGNRW